MNLKYLFSLSLLSILSFPVFSQQPTVSWSEPITLKNTTGIYYGNPARCIGQDENHLFLIVAKDLKEEIFVLRKVDKQKLSTINEIEYKGQNAFVNTKTIDVFFEEYNQSNDQTLYYVNRYDHNLQMLEKIDIMSLPSVPCIKKSKNFDMTPYLEKHNIPINDWSKMTSPGLMLVYDEKTKTYAGRNICMFIVLDENFKVLQQIDNTLDESLSLTKYAIDATDKSLICYGPEGVKTKTGFKPFTNKLQKGVITHALASINQQQNTIAVATLTGKKYGEANVLTFSTYSITGETKAETSIALDKDALAVYKKFLTGIKVFSINENSDGSYGIYIAREDINNLPSAAELSPTNAPGFFGPVIYLKLSPTGEVLSHTQIQYSYASIDPFKVRPYPIVNGNQTTMLLNDPSRKDDVAGIMVFDNTTGEVKEKSYITLPKGTHIAPSFSSPVTDKTFIIIAPLTAKKFSIGYLIFP